MNKKDVFKTGLMLLFMSFMVSCSEDNDDMGSENPEAYNTEVYLTDAPIDDANVQAAFVTVTNVMVNGKAIEGFEKTTVEISSLTNGETLHLGDLQLKNGATSSITLMLDSETDAAGEAPGNYILTADGEKKALATSANEIVISDDAEIKASDENQLILDFDLRKSIVSNAEGEYSFVSNSELAGNVRAVNTLNAGRINGTVDNMENSDAETMLVFAYKKGEYSESEKEADASGARFSNAVNSSVVSESNGNFSLHFLEEGEYELHFASYSDNDSDAALEFEGMAEASSKSELDLLGLNVTAQSQTTVEVSLSGLLGL
ncbi:DUF4382 domain-containing protein [Salegentibacter chungangensis]|uniref:DUF4382 domain-containing protein n=1 Tax=Salegentibacter chungangensis TaxID=1335724 RepID=A0ABW3NQT9_9FLAO